MSFSKRHYEAIAEAFQEAYREAEKDETGRAAFGVSLARRELADKFARDNSQFKRARFLAACEPGANVRARTNYKVVA